MKKLTQKQAETIASAEFMQYNVTHSYLFENGYSFYGVTRPPALTDEFLNNFKRKLRKRGILDNV